MCGLLHIFLECSVYKDMQAKWRHLKECAPMQVNQCNAALVGGRYTCKGSTFFINSLSHEFLS